MAVDHYLSGDPYFEAGRRRLAVRLMAPSRVASLRIDAKDHEIQITPDLSNRLPRILLRFYIGALHRSKARRYDMPRIRAANAPMELRPFDTCQVFEQAEQQFRSGEPWWEDVYNK